MPYDYASDTVVESAKQARQIKLTGFFIDLSVTPHVITATYECRDVDGNVIYDKEGKQLFGVDVKGSDVIIARAAQANITAQDVYDAIQAYVYASGMLGIAGIPATGSIS